MPDTGLARLAARADLCRLLAACYYEPGPEFAEEKLFDSLVAAAAVVDPAVAKFAEDAATQFAAEPLEVLRVDYTALFLHPTLPRALPYESAWTVASDPMAQHEAIDAVTRCYRANGFDVDEGFRDLPDHVAAELEFLYAVLFREAHALHAGNEPARAAAAATRRTFVANHLGRWIPPFAGAMQAGADTSFYKSLAMLTQANVALEGV